jgi:hypothetical protein
MTDQPTSADASADEPDGAAAAAQPDPKFFGLREMSLARSLESAPG